MYGVNNKGQFWNHSSVKQWSSEQIHTVLFALWAWKRILIIDFLFRAMTSFRFSCAPKTPAKYNLHQEWIVNIFSHDFTHPRFGRYTWPKHKWHSSILKRVNMNFVAFVRFFFRSGGKKKKENNNNNNNPPPTHTRTKPTKTSTTKNLALTPSRCDLHGRQRSWSMRKHLHSRDKAEAIDPPGSERSSWSQQLPISPALITLSQQSWPCFFLCYRRGRPYAVWCTLSASCWKGGLHDLNLGLRYASECKSRSLLQSCVTVNSSSLCC